jgi:hypothetical protein
MREERSGKLIWDDQSKRGENWYMHQQKAWKRIRTLLRTEDNADVDLTGYGLGNVRTLRDYEMYAGVDFKRKGVQQYTLDNKLPGMLIQSEGEWKESIMPSFYHCINFDKTVFKHKDYNFWLVAFDDADGIAINREDLNESQIKAIMSQPNNIVGIERFFIMKKQPVRWVIWAHSKSQGWAERIEGQINRL